jgi:phosphatidylserine/phosphatidylglycerophosphate/cardiolipin synthase-like enzyme
MTKRTGWGSATRTTTRTALLFALLLLILYGLQVTGVLDLGLFDLDSQGAPLETADDVAGDRLQIYFTSPRYPDKEADRRGGLDEILASDVARARRSVDVAAYDFDLERVADALVAAHERGLQVRLVTDTDNADLRQVRQLRRAGIPVVADDRGAIMHNKFVILDGEIVWTGSWNLTENGTYRNNNNALRIVSSALAENYRAEFEEMFVEKAFGPTSPANTPHPEVSVSDPEAQTTVLIENFFAPEDGVGEQIVALVEDAQESIRFMAFSFTDDHLGDVLKEQDKAGLVVQGVFEARGADTEYSEFGRLRRARPPLDVLTDGNPYIMHHKVIILDDRIVITGSFNFTANADESNDENVLVIHSPEVAARYRAEFERIYAQAADAQE